MGNWNYWKYRNYNDTRGFLKYLKENERNFKLDGKEFVTTIFNPIDDDIMILILGDNIDGSKEGLTFLYLYLSINGEVEHGLETLAFNNSKEAKGFIENLSSMSALDFMFTSLGVRPGYFL
ncbi:hypothetical protein CSV75_12495 [Sporosarcina sp. P18a]|uniref:hypothetical protein n=1 Tax=Sporosarcina sp. P18a TaxID=2048259 RepID=UPI000C170306|nr:hypothetical protein [Sporosarcina sp. P18a]PIC79405.1 hypothetical protein CSV75_12495 [Sporosarcina sp. P18a]